MKDGARKKLQEKQVCGLHVLRVILNPDCALFKRRLCRCARNMRQSGCRRVLTCDEFPYWDHLARYGLQPVNPIPFLQSGADRLVLALLARSGVDFAGASVALRGRQADRAMIGTAERLIPRVHKLIIDAPRGGDRLAQWLRERSGAAVLPPEERGDAAVLFSAVAAPERERLKLYGSVPALGGLRISGGEMGEEAAENIRLLQLLWESGKLRWDSINIT